MWPSFRSSFGRVLNRVLLLRQLSAVVQSSSEPPVAITTIPIVADLLGRLRVSHWIYYCVDDFGLWPGLDQRTMRQMEELLVARADVLFAVSVTLQEKLRGMGRSAHLLTHGVDLDFWAADGKPCPLAEVAALERPLVVFWGVIDRRMDVNFLRRLSDDLSAGTILLVGPEADPDPALSRVPRVVRIGQVPFDHLPGLAREAGALVMPYADLPVTRAMQPLKLKEYLATGQPTIVRDLPACREWADCLDLADTPEAFSQAVRTRLREGVPEAQATARLRLSGESWQSKAAELERLGISSRPNLETAS
jgi:glycosyltransferase involved in cell wall biosynthesis